MSEDRLERRDFLMAGVAGAALAAVPGMGFAQTGRPPQLTLHVLDVHAGKPGANMRVDLSVLDGDRATLLKTVHTQGNGRAAQPLLTAADIKVGAYELLFHVADYYKAQDVALPTLPFLNKVPVRFAIFDAAQAYHIPLLLTPWSYSTYRGS
jgi:5-hydroxyisourate hydrolase